MPCGGDRVNRACLAATTVLVFPHQHRFVSNRDRHVHRERGGLLAINPQVWLENDVPRRYRTASAVENVLVLVLPSLVGAGIGSALRLPNWPLAALAVLPLSGVAVAFFIYVERRRWPMKVGLDPCGMLFVYPDGRKREVWWKDIAMMRLVPASVRHETYLSIRYRDGQRETRGFAWGSCARQVHEYWMQRGTSTPGQAVIPTQRTTP